jgi:hypothetical protein
MHAISKGQGRWVAKGDAVAQRQFIHAIFGITAQLPPSKHAVAICSRYLQQNRNSWRREGRPTGSKPAKATTGRDALNGGCVYPRFGVGAI